MGKPNIEALADKLNQARVSAQPIAQISKSLGEFVRADAYAIQEKQLKTRIAQGEKQIGWKMGLTSEAKRKQMGLDSPLYGFLTAPMQVSGVFSLQGTIHPKIEPEVAFLISEDLSGVVTREKVVSSCRAVAACMEILDSRYEEFRYFSMEDVIADNASSSHFVLGPWLEGFKNLDLLGLEMEMSVDGKQVQKGRSSDISGDPVVSVIQLCALLAERDQKLKAGSIVLAGAATAAVALTPGMRVALKVSGLPTVSVETQ